MHQLAQQYPDVYFMGCGLQIQNNKIKREHSFYKKHSHRGLLKISIKEYLKHALKDVLPVWTSVACVKKTHLLLKTYFLPILAQQGEAIFMLG